MLLRDGSGGAKPVGVIAQMTGRRSSSSGNGCAGGDSEAIALTFNPLHRCEESLVVHTSGNGAQQGVCNDPVVF